MIIRKPAFDGFSFVKFYAKTTTSGIDIGYKEGLKKKIVKANEDLKEVKYEYKTN